MGLIECPFLDVDIDEEDIVVPLIVRVMVIIVLEEVVERGEKVSPELMEIEFALKGCSNHGCLARFF